MKKETPLKDGDIRKYFESNPPTVDIRKYLVSNEKKNQNDNKIDEINYREEICNKIKAILNKTLFDCCGVICLLVVLTLINP